MKILYCNGDSWTAGVEIPYVQTPNYLGHTDQYYGSWPWHLSEMLDMVCINEAVGGTSNDRIYRKTSEYILKYIGKGKSPADLTIVVGWTTPERTEVFCETEYCAITIQAAKTLNKNKFETELLNSYKDVYYQLYNDDIGNKVQLKYMLTLRMMCKNLGIRYYDFNAIGMPMHDFQNLALSTYNIQLDNFLYYKTWGYYCYENKCEMFPFGHPGIETHKDWARLISENIK